MKKYRNPLEPLETIELWCKVVESAHTLTGISSAMMSLLLEVEYAIKKYSAMEEQMKTALPWNISVQDIEKWNMKLYQESSTYLLKNIKGYNKRFLESLIFLDEDEETFYESTFSDEETDTEESVTPLSEIDKELVNGIADVEIREKIAEARNKMMDLDICTVLRKKMAELHAILKNMMHLLNAPTSEALNDVYRHFDATFREEGSLMVCKRMVIEWLADHEGKKNILQLFDQKLSGLREEIEAAPYAEVWDDFFETDSGQTLAQGCEIGRFIYRHIKQFKGSTEFCKQFLSHINLWFYFNQKKVGVENKQKQATVMPVLLAQATPANTAETGTFGAAVNIGNQAQQGGHVNIGEQTQVGSSVNTTEQAKPGTPIPSEPANTEGPSIYLPASFAPDLRSNKEASDLLKKTLAKIDSKINARGGNRSEKWQWPHVCDAFKELGLLDSEIKKSDFGAAIHFLISTRSAASVSQSFKAGRINDDYPTLTDKSIIAEIVKLFQPVKKCLKDRRQVLFQSE